MKVYIDLQKLAISKVVDGTSPEYAGDINSNVFEILFFNYDNTNWFPTMSQLAPNGREAGDFEADSLGVGETHDYTEDGVNYQRFTFTMGSAWVLMKGRSNLFVWYNVLNGTVVKKCVGKLNVMLNESNDNYFISNPVFNPAVKSYIDGLASDIEDELNDKVDAQNATIASLSQASPSVFDTAANIQLLQENKGVAVATDTGYIWYWDTTITPNAYVSSGLQYNSLANYTKHSGNQLQDANGNNIYPDISQSYDYVGLKQETLDITNGYETFFTYGTFQNGGLVSGVVQSWPPSRVVSKTIISIDREITLSITAGYKIGIHYFVNGTFSSDSGWQQNSYTIPANSTFRILIALVSEDQSVTANIIDFLNQVTFQPKVNAVVTDAVNDIKYIKQSTEKVFNDVCIAGYDNNLVSVNLTLTTGKTYRFMPMLRTWSVSNTGGQNSKYIVGKTYNGTGTDLYKISGNNAMTEAQDYTLVAEANTTYYIKARANYGTILRFLVFETNDNDFDKKITRINNNKKYCYSGDKLPLNNYNIEQIGVIRSTTESQLYQGMACYNNYCIFVQNTGIANLFTLDKTYLTFTRLGTFDLASKDANNHANICCFGNEKGDASDVLPVLYVSQCYNGTVDGKKDVCYVERINVSTLSSTLVQTINFDDTNHLFGYALNWIVDNKNNRLIGYGNTISNYGYNNQIRIVTFNLPSLSQGSSVTLTNDDIIENYILSDEDSDYPNSYIMQGGTAINNILILPTGVGSDTYPTLIYVWDMKNKSLRNVIDLSKNTLYEFEDCDVFDGGILFNTSNGVVYYFKE